MNKKVSLISLLVLLFLYCTVYAYDDKTTHRAITILSMEKSNLKNFLKNELGIKNDLDQKYYNRTISDLIQDGSENEDSGFRARNHFWNPIHNEGLHDVGCGWFWNNDNFWAFRWWDCWNFTGLPNPDWAIGEAQDGSDLDDCGEGDHSSDDDCNDYSWRRARQTYYEALVATSEQVRNNKFADFYEKLGRVLHLLQDMGAPAHTRNDMFGHLDLTRIEFSVPYKWMGNLYEFWVKKKLEEDRTYIESVSQNIIIPEFVKAEDYWDKGIYDGAFPDDTMPGNGAERCGLAEYSNANFLSKRVTFNEGFPFGDDHYFPYPAKSSIENMPPEEITAEDGNIEMVLYLRKDKDGEIVERLALARYFSKELLIKLMSLDIDRYYRLAYILDDKVHESYAEKLIPKTVAYTTGLINYFFRGTIEIQLPADARSSSVFKLNAKNTSLYGEEMSSGVIELVVRYELNGNTYYIVVPEQNGVNAISRDDFVELNFDLTNNPIPPEALNIFLQVVYNGLLGQENYGIGVGGKELDAWIEPWGDNLCDYHDWTVNYIIGGGTYTNALCLGLPHHRSFSNSVKSTSLDILIEDGLLKMEASGSSNPGESVRMWSQVSWTAAAEEDRIPSNSTLRIKVDEANVSLGNPTGESWAACYVELWTAGNNNLILCFGCDISSWYNPYLLEGPYELRNAGIHLHSTGENVVNLGNYFEQGDDITDIIIYSEIDEEVSTSGSYSFNVDYIKFE